MKSFYSLLFMSLIGIVVGITVILYNQMPSNSQTEPIPQFNPPYKNFVAGTGIVEASSKNIQIGAMVSGVLNKVYVQSGDNVKEGELLFSIDDKAPKDNIKVLQAAVKLSKMKLLKAQHQLEILKNFKKISSEMVKKTDYIAAQDIVNEEKAALNLAKSNVISLQKKLAFYKVYSPIDGKVLESKLSVGKYFNTKSNLLTIGSDTLNLRVSINEYDVWKFHPKTKAVAYIRGHPKLKTTLQYLYTMPYVVPKKNLTGISTERTDTRVLQIIYALPKEIKFPLYIGEQLDVFIQTKNKEN